MESCHWISISLTLHAYLCVYCCLFSVEMTVFVLSLVVLFI